MPDPSCCVPTVKRLFHGSRFIIEHPEYGKGKPYNDYGRGFYCTESAEMAKEWAVGENCDGYANCYRFDCSGLDILNLNDQSYCLLNWLAVLLDNRTLRAGSSLAFEAKEYVCNAFRVDYKDRDVIVGYRADDSYFSFAEDFLSGTISYRQLGRAMYLGKLGRQFVVKSKRAFDRLEFDYSEKAPCTEWYARKADRDAAARREYLDLERNRRKRGDLYIAQIIDEEMTADDPRLHQHG